MLKLDPLKQQNGNISYTNEALANVFQSFAASFAPILPEYTGNQDHADCALTMFPLNNAQLRETAMKPDA